jgi:uncharacterized protein (TIGR02145 family)
VPNSVTVPGFYSWKVRCACNLSPLEATPFSVLDSFIVPDSFACGNVTDVEGNFYTGIKIGRQCWLQQNLKTSHYPDGTPLVDGTGVGDITGDYVTPYYFSYLDNPMYADTFGYLYTWAAVMNGESASDSVPSGVQGICPDGWHVPSIRELDILNNYLGGGGVSGGPLKDTIYWNPPNVAATNSSGFSALPTGDRIDFGSFVNIYDNADWWSASDSGLEGNAWIRCLYSESDNFGRALLATGRKAAAFPCRCIKD